jgi:ABC-type phosphate/phosphonate transport system substrate-binding protein
MDVVFYTNYELQVKALAEGHLDMAWNSPLAWLDSVRKTKGRCRAIGMRDTDRDRVSCLVVRKDSKIEALSDLKGKRISFGAKDSPQATLIPQIWLAKKGLQLGQDYEAMRFDILVGKHGDHVGGEREAFNALTARQADACAMIDLNWSTWTNDGTIDPVKYRVLEETGKYDHCVFTVRDDFPPELETPWSAALFSMSYDNPKHREMMDMEGLKAWMPPRTTGFDLLAEAVDKFNFFEGGSR